MVVYAAFNRSKLENARDSTINQDPLSTTIGTEQIVQNQSLNEEIELESLQGSRVYLVPHGDVTVIRKYPLPKLTFRLTDAKAKEILGSDDHITLRFTLDSVQLCAENTVLYQRTVERLLLCPSGEYWLIQLSYELELLQDLKSEDNSASEAAKDTQTDTIADLMPHEQTLRPGEWARQELRLKLLRGGEFKFKDNRMTLLDIQIRLTSCISESVFLKAELVEEGRTHNEPCGLDHDNEVMDPGCRLGLKTCYRTATGAVDEYVHISGDSNAMKLDFIVDLLDGRDREWTSQQTRRFIKNHKGKRYYCTTPPLNAKRR